MKTPEGFEEKKMAVINLTCDHPGEYGVFALARWARVSYPVVKRLHHLLDLDILEVRKYHRNKQIINIRLSDYLPKKKRL
jgi:hypothetical protein